MDLTVVEPSGQGQARGRKIILPGDAEARLKNFGLTVEMITRSIESGDTARRKVMQPVYPATYAGVTMWAETLAELRRQLLKCRDGYDIGRTENYETVYSTDRSIAFAVHSGDSSTGINGDRDPRLTRPKGVKTKQRVEYNSRDTQLTLIELPSQKLPPDEACETWFLLLKTTRDEIRLELSCPKSIDADGIVGGWHERILLPPVQISGAVDPIEPPDGGDDSSGGETLVRR